MIRVSFWVIEGILCLPLGILAWGKVNTQRWISCEVVRGKSRLQVGQQICFRSLR